jgi:hypothetical protein
MTECPSHADLAARLRALSRMAPAPSPVVSVFLNTHWTQPVELGEALAERVVATGGSVDMVEEPWLGRVEGVAALLRYPV